MKTVEQIISGLEADIKMSEDKVRVLSPNAYLHGDSILIEKTKIRFATNMINFIRS